MTVNVDGEDYWVTAGADGRAAVPNISISDTGPIVVVATVDESSAAASVRILPGWISLTPAFLAIAVALLLRNVLPALLIVNSNKTDFSESVKSMIRTQSGGYSMNCTVRIIS